MTAFAGPLRELPAQLVLDGSDRASLYEALVGLQANPYTEYDNFMVEISGLAQGGDVPDELARVAKEASAVDARDEPFVLIQNCPIDQEVPVWDFDDPVNDKRRRKTTFVAEGFLALWSVLRGTPPIGYINVNDGDVFQDIFPMRSLASSQSQKALGEIYFHKDLANHFVRPDYVNMICLRSDNRNLIYTSFVKNREALGRLPDHVVAQLREPEYHTPYDDLSLYGGKVDLGEAQSHPVLSGELDLRFFENRTKGLNPRAQDAVDALVSALHQVKARVLLQPGDFLSEHNNFSIHCKEVVSVGAPEEQRARWIMKTVNVERLSDHQEHFLPDRPGIVAG